MQNTRSISFRTLNTLALVSLLWASSALWAQVPQQPALPVPGQGTLPVPGAGIGQTTTPTSQVPIIGVAAGDYELGPGDVVQIQVPFGEQMSGLYTVDRGGNLTVPLIGRVEAAGKTVPAVETIVSERAAEFVRDAQAIVGLIQKRIMQVTVTGSVAQPSIYQVSGVTTLLEVLAQAGGPSADAGPIIKVSRHPEQGLIPHPEAQVDELGRSFVDIPKDDVIRLRGDTNLVLRPGDIVSIDVAEMVYVMAMGRQGMIPLEDAGEISVVNALVRAGVQPGSKANESTILRKIASASDGESIVIDPVDVEKIFKGEIPDVLLYPDDLLYVPPDEGPGIGREVLDQGVRSALNVLTWGLF